MEAGRSKAMELGVFLLVVALPLAFTPFSAAPFADPKLVFLATGALLLWLGRPAVDHRLAIVGLARIALVALAAIVSVDPFAGLVASTIGGGGGLVLSVGGTALAVGGTGIPDGLAARARGWLVWCALAVSTLLLLFRLAPEVVEAASPNLSLIGATLGNQLFAVAFVAAALGAAVAGPPDARHPAWRRSLEVVVLTLGIAAAGERSSLILPLVAVPVAIWRARPPVKTAISIVAVIVVSFLAWQLVEPALPGGRSPESAVEQIGSSATDAGRFVVWRVAARAWADRPLAGWGPNTTHASYLRTATRAEVETATRKWNDAHDLFLETGVTTGVLGVVALVLLMSLLVVGALRAPPETAWTVAAAAALGAYSLVEPLNIVLTPLLFLFAGIAAGAGARAGSRARPARPWTSLCMGIVLAGAVVLTLQQFAAAVFEQQGTTYGELSALRTAIRIEPWRLSAQEELARQLAVLGRSGDEVAAEEARRTIADAVAQHPWDADVRVTAADVSTLVHRDGEAMRWLVEQLARFPGDADSVAGRANAPTG